MPRLPTREHFNKAKRGEEDLPNPIREGLFEFYKKTVPASVRVYGESVEHR